MIIYFISSLLYLLLDIITMCILEFKYAKKCGYNCDQCKNWHCMYHTCKRKRKN